MHMLLGCRSQVYKEASTDPLPNLCSPGATMPLEVMVQKTVDRPTHWWHGFPDSVCLCVAACFPAVGDSAYSARFGTTGTCLTVQQGTVAERLISMV